MATPKVKRPHKKTGRKTLYNADTRSKIKFMARRGFTDVEMAALLSVTEQTFNNWKKKHPEFFEALKDWKLEADEKIQRSLYELARGYEHPEIKVFTHLIKGKVKVTEVDLTKYYAPSASAAIFWLKNRLPDQYKDKHEITGKDGAPINVSVIKFSGEDDDSGA